MSPFAALFYSLVFGLLHGILPDEHTWPITFSYAIGGASGREGLKAGLYFSAAFTLQRAILSELAYLALAQFLLSSEVNGAVYAVVGLAMAAAGLVVLRRNIAPHIHLLASHRQPHGGKEGKGVRGENVQVAAPPVRWTMVHGFVAGFSVGGFSLFVNTVAAPAMPSPWLGFLPGLFFGLGTMAMLVFIGMLIGASLRWTRSLSPQQVKEIGAMTGGRTLFFGGLLFTAAGIALLLGLERRLPVDMGALLIGAFMVLVAVPAFVFSWREVVKKKEGLPR